MKKSVQKRLQEAYYRGDNTISFKINEIGISTLRVYVSNLSTSMGVKMKVTNKGSDFVVLLKEKPPKVKLLDDINEAIKRSGLNLKDINEVSEQLKK